MICLPQSEDLLTVARHVIWFEPPEKALERPYRFMAYLMTYGTADDLEAVKEVVSMEEFKEALEHAPPGIFDKRSWAYWNLVCGFDPALPIPVRKLPG